MNRTSLYFIGPFLLSLMIAWVIQANFLLAGDVGYLMYVTHQLIQGGAYGREIFETNPPMILYLYYPVVQLAKLTSIDIILMVRLYIFLLSFISLSCCFYLLKQIFKPEDRSIAYIIYDMSLFVLLILPMAQFAQREHLLMILILPYLFSTILALENKQLPMGMAWVIGLTAGLGFALKPFFLVPLILIESYLIVHKRALFGWVRAESIAIAAVLVIYLISIFIFQSSYIYVMLPLISHLYFVGTKQPWLNVFLHPIVIWSLFVIGCFLVFYKKDRYRQFSTVMVLAIIGMLIAVIIPRAPWFYHLLPAFGFSCLLLMYYVADAILASNKKSTAYSTVIYEICFKVCMIAVIFFMPIYMSYKFLRYNLSEKVDGDNAKLITYISHLPGVHSVYCYSVSRVDCFPLVDLTHSRYGGSFPFFWWIRGLVRLENHQDKQSLTSQIVNDKASLFAKVVSDLHQYKTELIIVNDEMIHAEMGGQFDLIEYLSQNEKFRETWRNYRYLTSIGSYQIYQRNAGS